MTPHSSSCVPARLRRSLPRVLAAGIAPVALALLPHAEAAPNTYILDSGSTPFDLSSSIIHAGLLEGWIDNTGAIDIATSNPGNGGTSPGASLTSHLVDRLRMGETNAKNSDHQSWSDNQTWVYTGQFYDADGIFTFAENIDDDVQVKIDGVQVLFNQNWDVATRTNNGGLGDGNNYGAGPVGNGWHTIEVRFKNGGGGAGTVETNGWGAGGGGAGNGDFTNKGFGVNTGGSTSTTGNDYTIPIETNPLGGSAATTFRFIENDSVIEVRDNSTLSFGANQISATGLGQLVEIGALNFTTAGGKTLTVGPGQAATTLKFANGGNLNGFNSTINVAGADDTVSLGGPLLGGPASLTKAGSGKLVLAAGSGFTGGLIVSGGTVDASAAGSVIGQNAVTLSGGTLILPKSGLLGEYYNGDVGAQTGFGPNGVNDPNGFNAFFAGKGSPALTARTTSNGRTNMKFSGGPGIDGTGLDTAPFIDQGFSSADNIAVRYTGDFWAKTAGTYTFLTRSDDGSVLFIDGVKVVNNNNYQGMINATGTVSLTEGQHTIAVGFYEGGGGAGLEVRYTAPGGSDTFLTNDLLGGFHGTSVNTVNVTASSTLDLNGGEHTFGALTLAPGTTLTATAGSIRFPSTALGAGSATIAKNGSGKFDPGTVSGVAGQTLTQAGNGTLLISQPLVAGVGLRVASGTLELGSPAAAGNTPITIQGGTLKLPAAALLGEYWYGSTGANAGFAGDLAAFNTYFAGRGAPAVSNPSNFAGRTNFKFSSGPGLDGGDLVGTFADQGFTAEDQILARFSGSIYIDQAGTYTFKTRSDDGSVLFIDGTKVVDNNFDQGMTTREGSIALGVGYHSISMGYYEGFGGNGFEARYVPIGGSDQFLTNSLFGGFRGQTNPLSVTGNGSIDLNGGNADFGPLTLTGAPTLSINAGDMRVASTTGSGGIDKAAGNFYPGTVAAGTTLTKTGAGNIVLLESAALPSGAVINVNEGDAVVSTSNGGVNPLGSATMHLAGGGLALTSTNGNISVGGNIDMTANASISAGVFANGVASTSAAPVTATLSTALNIPAGRTLTAQSSAGYTLAFGAGVTGAGTLNVLGPKVELKADSTVGTLAIADGGRLRLSPTAPTLSVNVGSGVNVSGTLEASSGSTSLNGATITGVAPAANGLQGRIFVNGPDFSGSYRPANTQAGIAGLVNDAPLTERRLTGALNFGPIFNADPAFTSFFENAGPGSSNFSVVFTGVYKPTETGAHQFQATIHDDGPGVWVDLNQNGLFEANGSAGNELISSSGACCGDGGGNQAPVGTANLVAGQSYRVAFALEDTGGGSSLGAVFKQPSGAGLVNVDPSDAAQNGLWTGGVPVVRVNDGASLSAGSVSGGAAELNLTGNASLTLTSALASTADVLKTTGTPGATSTVTVSAGSLTVGHLSLSDDTTLIKSGTGTLTATTHTLRGNSELRVNGGTLVLNGTETTSNGGSLSTGHAVVNSTGKLIVNGALSGTAQVNAGGTIGGSGTIQGTLAVEGILAPGNSAGTLTTLSATSLGNTATLQIELNGAGAGQFDKLVTNGIALNGAPQIALTIGFALPLGVQSTFLIVDNTSADPVNGHLYFGANELTEGERFSDGFNDFTISYTAGTGNDILISVPEPGSFVALFSGIGVLLGLQRRRSLRRS